MAEYTSRPLNTVTPSLDLPSRDYSTFVGDAARSIAQSLASLRGKGADPTVPSDLKEALTEAVEIEGQLEKRYNRVAQEAELGLSSNIQQLEVEFQGPGPYRILEDEAARDLEANLALKQYSDTMEALSAGLSQGRKNISYRLSSIINEALNDPRLVGNPNAMQQFTSQVSLIKSARELALSFSKEEKTAIDRFNEMRREAETMGLDMRQYQDYQKTKGALLLQAQQTEVIAANTSNTQASWQPILNNMATGLTTMSLYETRAVATDRNGNDIEVPALINILGMLAEGKTNPLTGRPMDIISANDLVRIIRDDAIAQLDSLTTYLENGEKAKGNPIAIDRSLARKIIEDRFASLSEQIKAGNYKDLVEAERLNEQMSFWDNVGFAYFGQFGLGTAAEEMGVGAINAGIKTLASGAAALAGIDAAEYLKAMREGGTQRTASIQEALRSKLFLGLMRGETPGNLVAGALESLTAEQRAKMIPNALKPGTEEYAQLASKIVRMATGQYTPTMQDEPWVDAVLRHAFNTRMLSSESGDFTPEQKATTISKLQQAQFDITSPWSELLSADTLNPRSITYTGLVGEILRANPVLVKEHFTDPVSLKLESYLQDLPEKTRGAIVYSPASERGFSFVNFEETRPVRAAVGGTMEVPVTRTVTSNDVKGGKLLQALQGYHFFLSQIVSVEEARRRSEGLAQNYGLTIRGPSGPPSRRPEVNIRTPAQEAISQEDNQVIEEQVQTDMSNVPSIDDFQDILGQ